MQNTAYEDYDDAAGEPPSRAARIRGVLSTFIGALVAVCLLLAMGVWFYRLGVRDAQNVPIIRAATTPEKTRPVDPGGAVTPHQDVSSYEIAESGGATAAAVVVAPTPPRPKPEDVAMGELAEKPEAGDAQVDDQPVQRSLPQPVADTEQALQRQTETEVAAAIDRVLTEDAAAPAAEETAPTETRLAALGDEPREAAEVDVAVQDEELIFEGATDLAPADSPIAQRRPANFTKLVKQARVEAERSVDDTAARAARSTVQIQLAADPSEAAIRTRWKKIFGANKDILRDRALAIQTTQSGGRTFYRLRVGPFDSRSEAASVCQALKSRGQDCIVARNG